MDVIDIKKIKKDLYFLLRNNEKSLDTDIKELQTVITRFKNLYNTSTDKIKGLIEKIIKKSAKPTEIKINTIGSFLFGAQNSNYGDIDKYNSALYYGSIGFVDKTDKQIWIQTEKGVRWVNEGLRFDKAYFFIDKSKFGKNDMKKIKEANIQKYSFIITENSKHLILKKARLEDYIDHNTDENNKSKFKMLKSAKGSSFTFVALILIFIIALFLIFKTRRN